MIFRSWGYLPPKQPEVISADDIKTCEINLKRPEPIICYGNGRSYGDSAFNDHIVTSRPLNKILSFDKEQGIIRCQSGVLLAEILDLIVNKGWFLTVTPGTKFITIGGAISTDVHGKNQHKVGSFSDSVLSFDILLADGSVKTCSHSANQELFKAVCGGMGLMGIILEATIQLIPIQSTYIEQTTICANNLEDMLAAFEQNADSTYSVAWIDCHATAKNLGRGVLTLGEHTRDKQFHWQQNTSWSLPFGLSGLLLNRLSGKLFNQLYFFMNKRGGSKQRVALDKYFYPLDGIKNWNILYGNKGFIQYQFVIPKEQSHAALHEVLSTISRHKPGAFLSVLKLFGPGNENYLSFPMKGYTLAVDFKISSGLEALLKELDTIVNHYHGRLYLAKDQRISAEDFASGYPQLETFKSVRKNYNATEKFQSYQSNRLGL